MVAQYFDQGHPSFFSWMIFDNIILDFIQGPFIASYDMIFLKIVII